MRGGNSNNGAYCGLFYLTLNELASRTNWNYGSAVSYLIKSDRLKSLSVCFGFGAYNVLPCPCLLAKMVLDSKHLLVGNESG